MATQMKRGWKLQEFVAHGSNVNCIALGNKSGRVLVTGGDDKKVNLWAVGKSKCIISLSGHTTPIECVRFCNSEELVCAGSLSGALKIWDLEAAKILRTLTGHKANLKCLDFHPYGEFLASGSADSNIKLWDIRRKGCIFTYKGHRHSVNSLKFSPDGRWIASAGEDGVAKLWDLHAGKMLTEFSGHSAPVNDIQFHPNDFLLATGSADKSVKFWDLESFQLVSTSDLDNSAIRCIYFNPGGECLFSGSQDSLKVYGWEPTRIYDSVDIKWGKVSSISTSLQNQLIGASYHLMQVSLFIVDLKKVRPLLSCTPDEKYSPITTSSLQPGTPMRKSFTRRPVTGSKLSRPINVKNCQDRESSPTPDAELEDDAMSPAVINEPADYRAIFQPRRRELTRTPPIEIYVAPFPAPPEVEPETSEIRRSVPLSPPVIDTRQNSVQPDLVRPEPIHQIPPTEQVSVRSQPDTLIVSKPQKELNRVTINRSESNSVRTETTYRIEQLSRVESVSRIPTEPVSPSSPQPRPHLPIDSLRLNSVEPNVTRAPPVVRTVPRKLDKEPDVVLQSRTRPDLLSIKSQDFEAEKLEKVEATDFVPTQRDRSVGLDMDEFLPHNMRFNDPLRLNSQQQPEMSEAEAISSIIKGHDSMIAVLNNRLRNIQIIYTLWTNKDLKTALESAVYMNDMSVIVDVLNNICLKPSIWSLDLCVTVLPSIFELLRSKYETYMTTGCDALRLVLRNFANLIRSNVAAPPGVGIDLSREERYNKCLTCYNQLVSIRAFILKRQTLQGKLGHMFRDLHVLLQALD